MPMLWTKPTDAGPASPTGSIEAQTPSSPTRQKIPGRRFAQIVKLKPEFVDKYKEVHAHVWPEVLKQLKASNIEDCTSTSEHGLAAAL